MYDINYSEKKIFLLRYNPLIIYILNIINHKINKTQYVNIFSLIIDLRIN